MSVSTGEMENAVVREFDNYLLLLSSNKMSANLEKLIADDFQRLLNTYEGYGESLPTTAKKELSDDALLEKYLAHFYLPEKLKELGILHRDVLIEYVKALMYEQERALTKAEMELFVQQSFKVLKEATDTFVDRFNEFRARIQQSPKEIMDLRKKLLLVENPWEVYRDQLRELQVQIAEITADKDRLLKIGASIEGIKDFFVGVYQKNQALADYFIEGYGVLTEPLSKKNAKSYIQQMDHLSDSSQTYGNGEVNYMAIEDMQFPADVIRASILAEDGSLEIREFNLKKGFRKWMDYGIVPVWSKLIDQENTFRIKTQVRLGNMINSLQLFEQSGLEGENERIQEAFNDLVDDALSFKETSRNILDGLEKRLREDLSLLKFVKGGRFMEIPLQSTIDFSHKTVYASTRNTIKKYLNLAFRWYESAGKEEAKSLYEVGLSSIEQRMGNFEPDRYDSIFLNKNFLGDLFLVERSRELELAASTIKSWEIGFAKSLLVTGAHLCGKSTFIESLGREHFKSTLVHLSPYTEAVVDGRKFSVTADLSLALQYIKNHNLQSTRLAVIIDSLEIWRDQDTSIYENVRALMQFADDESDDFFLIVGASDFLVNHLETRFGFLKHFTSTIDLSKASREEIFEAIMTRHQATHRQLVDEKGNHIGDNRVSAFIKWLSKKYRYNLGCILQAWTFHTLQLSDEKIIITKNIQDFVDFFTPHEKIILKHLLLYTTTSEFEIKLLVGNLYKQSIGSSIKRLINANILDRDLKGSLSIKPMFINDIAGFINPI